jgi:hypothetical protein
MFQTILNLSTKIQSEKMKKLLLCFLLLFSAEVFAQENSSEDLTQGVWKAVVEKNLTVSPSQEEVKSFSAKSVTDIYYDHNYQAKDKNDDALLKSILGSKIRLNKNFSVSSVIKLDAADKYDSDFVTNSAGGNVTGKGNGDRFFKNQALQIDEITANYQNKNLTIIAGKFVPDFGINWKSPKSITILVSLGFCLALYPLGITANVLELVQ